MNLKTALLSCFNPADPYMRNNVLLLKGDGTNGAQNNTFLDSSSNNFQITRNGNVTQGSFSPYGEYWSVNFNSSTSDYLTVNNPAAMTGDFTIEAFVNMTSLPSYNMLLGPATGLAYYFAIRATGVEMFIGTNNFPAWSYTFAVNTWYHVVLCRQSGTLKCYVNGTQLTLAAGNASDTSAFMAGSLYVGRYNSATPWYFNGALSNLRIVSGVAIVPPAGGTTVPLTLTGTTSGGTSYTASVLTCQSNRFIDKAGNTALTVSGTPKVTKFSPFAPTEYSPATVGGSGYFDGAGDSLNTASQSALGFGTGDFTAELWFYAPSVSGAQDLITFSDNATNLGVSSGSVFYFNGSGIITFGSPVANQWNHIAASRVSGTLSLYLNGVRGYTGSDTTNTGARTARIGVNAAGTGSYLTGYVSDARIVKGAGLYSGTPISLPALPLTAVTNTSLLLNFRNAAIYDSTQNNVLETAGNAQISTTVKKWGTGAIYFDGTGGYLIGPTTPLVAFGNGDFTLECWAYPTVNNYLWLFDFRPVGTAAAAVPSLYTANGTITYYVNGVTAITASAPALNAWSHIAICRSGTSTRLFINGVQAGSTYSDTVNYVAGPLKIGRNEGTLFCTGYIDDIRITRGVARYTSNFTVPQAPFPDAIAA